MDVTDDERLMDMVLNKIYEADPADMRLLCMEIYDRLYRIRENEDDGEEHPWAVMLHSDKETLYNVLPKDFYYDQFMMHGVYKQTGLSWAEFKKTDFDEAELILKKVREQNEREAKMEMDAQAKVERQFAESSAAANLRSQYSEQRKSRLTRNTKR